MKFTKKIAVAATCAVMSMTSMIGMAASATNISENADTNYIDTLAINSVTTKTLTDYSICKQGSSNTCWAVAISSMHSFITKPKEAYTEEALVDILNGIEGCDGSNGATIDEALKVMKKIFPSTSYTVTKATSLTVANIKSHIDNNRPIYLAATGKKGTKTVGHAVVITGYDFDNVTKEITKIHYANPATGDFSSTTYSGTSTSFTSDNVTYTWDKVITIKPVS